jgi:hypothetical protein
MGGWADGRMAMGGHGLPRVPPRPAVPYPFTPCGPAIPETALPLFQGGRPAAIFYPFGHPTPYANESSHPDPLSDDDAQTRISWGIHGLPKVSLGPAMH